MPVPDRRPSAIPRVFPPKRAIPTAPALKGNAPIPLRGTRPTAPTPDVYTSAPPRTRLPSGPRFHVPVMHSPALRDPAPRASTSTASIYTQSGRTVGEDRSHEHYPEADEEKESDDGSQAASDPDDHALSPGFGLIEALAFERDASSGEMGGNDKMFKEMSWRAFEKSTSGGTDMPMERKTTTSPRAGHTRNSSPAASPQFDDTTTTPRARPWQSSAIAGPSTAPGHLAMETSTDMARDMDPTGSPRNMITDACNTALSKSQSIISIPSTPTPPRIPSGPYGVVRELEMLLGPGLVADYIDLPHILGAHDACPAPHSPSPPARAATVFGVPICMAARYASCSTVLGGQTHMLPIVVFAAVEELYRVGLKTPRLLRPGPSSGATLPALVAAFDMGPSYGDGIDLSIMPTARSSAPLDDISALLLTYLDCLPGPILVGPLLPALLRFSTRSPAPSNIKAAQLLLRLLPAPHFSLLVYLLAFLAQLPVYGDLNAWTMKGVAGEFARAVCGTCEEGEGEEVLEWLLSNWDVLSAGLFPGAEPPASTALEDDVGGRIAELERQHAAAVQAAYEAGATAERTKWVEEVQALREAGEVQERIMRRIVRRFVEGAPCGGVDRSH